jgi:hypothetical protein
MLPPTYCTCLEMFEFTSPGEALAAARELTVITPEAQVDDDGAYLSIPDRLVELGRTVGAQLRP